MFLLKLRSKLQNLVKKKTNRSADINKILIGLNFQSRIFPPHSPSTPRIQHRTVGFHGCLYWSSIL